MRTVPEMGWSGTKNGALLWRAGAEFDVLLTVDSNMELQQNMEDLPIAVVVLVAYSNDVDVLRPLMPQVRELLPTSKRVACTESAPRIELSASTLPWT